MKFSVVIPLYNKELSIGNTIESVLAQTYQDFEILVVNDGSTDRSVEAVQKILDDRIKIIDKSNEGVSATRNRGIDEAKYEWIAFLDGDDIWEENHLAEIVKMSKMFPQADMFATSFKYSDNRPIVFKKTEIRLVLDYFDECLDDHLIWTSIFVARKDCFKYEKFDTSLSLGEDLELWGRLVKKFEFVKSPSITATYRLDAENRSARKRYNLSRSFLLNLDFSKMGSESERIYYRRQLGQIFKNSIVNRDWKVSLRLFFKFPNNLIKSLIS